MTYQFGRFAIQTSAILILLIIFVFPIIFLVIKSFSQGWIWPMLFPSQWSMNAWESVGREPQLWEALNNTLIIGLMVTALNLLLGIPAAKVLSRKSRESWVNTAVFFPLLIPALAIAMGLHLIMIRLGLADHIAGVILIHLLPSLPYTVRILTSAFNRQGPCWEEQAYVLGASKAASFFQITFPMILPSIRSASLLAFVISLSQYVLTAIIGGGTVNTLAILFYPYFNSVNDGITAAFAVIFALLPVFFIILLELSLFIYRLALRYS
ncbi:ABC transporter permease [Bacillus sp. SCS-153A]|uniref:ABC transporter permease n=1 Tax=Rossellomorea sedimentorum TaxID=3115294 RepID=UPI003906B337